LTQIDENQLRAWFCKTVAVGTNRVYKYNCTDSLHGYALTGCFVNLLFEPVQEGTVRVRGVVTHAHFDCSKNWWVSYKLDKLRVIFMETAQSRLPGAFEGGLQQPQLQIDRQVELGQVV
jgi:hypothetical protein